jgi:hypothetical protein
MPDGLPSHGKAAPRKAPHPRRRPTHRPAPPWIGGRFLDTSARVWAAGPRGATITER